VTIITIKNDGPSIINVIEREGYILRDKTSLLPGDSHGFLFNGKNDFEIKKVRGTKKGLGDMTFGELLEELRAYRGKDPLHD